MGKPEKILKIFEFSVRNLHDAAGGTFWLFLPKIENINDFQEKWTMKIYSRFSFCRAGVFIDP